MSQGKTTTKNIGPITKAAETGKRLTADYIQKVTSEGKFYTKAFTPEGRPFFVFCNIGDQLYGQLLAGSRDNSHINRAKSYQILAYTAIQNGITQDYPEGQVEEFFTNRQLQRLFKQHELVGKFIRIVFIGRAKNNWGGHSSKVYDVFLDKGVATKMEVLIHGTDRKLIKSTA